MRIFVRLTTERSIGAYDSEVVPAVGTVIDTSIGAYRVIDIWHDISDGFTENHGKEHLVRAYVMKMDAE
jgi:hypothetical protein